MAKYIQRETHRKTVGVYLKAVKALNELNRLGEETGVHWQNPEINGLSGTIAQDNVTGEWHFVQA